MQSDKLYDKRILERNIKKNLLTKKDYEKHLGSLKDSANELEIIDMADELSDMPKAGDYKD